MSRATWNARWWPVNPKWGVAGQLFWGVLCSQVTLFYELVIGSGLIFRIDVYPSHPSKIQCCLYSSKKKNIFFRKYASFRPKTNPWEAFTQILLTSNCHTQVYHLTPEFIKTYLRMFDIARQTDVKRESGDNLHNQRRIKWQRGKRSRSTVESFIDRRDSTESVQALSTRWKSCKIYFSFFSAFGR